MNMAQITTWLSASAYFGDRHLQASVSVVFCMLMIVWAATGHMSSAEVADRIIDWSYGTLLGVIGVYHVARGIGDWQDKQQKIMN